MPWMLFLNYLQIKTVNVQQCIIKENISENNEKKGNIYVIILLTELSSQTYI